MPLSAQTVTSTIRGTVLEDVTQAPVVGAVVMAQTGDSTIFGANTDVNGDFIIENVPVGRLSVSVQAIGYEDRQYPNVVLYSGKDLVLSPEMTASFGAENEMVVSGSRGVGSANNEFTAVSARSFDAETAQRYAGSIQDPSRMAANFAGVNSAGDTRNDIVVRGNSPLGLLWRVEGVDVPNPNHFGAAGANGGPISILNNNTLGSSDFLTAAFPAEYGNAYAAAFDLSLRPGNTRKRETLFQIGANGVELLTEGPFKKGSRSSYLVSGRYSTLAVFDAVGIDFGGLLGVPEFFDGTAKFRFDAGNAGIFELWGLGGRSDIAILESELDPQSWADEEENLVYQDGRFSSSMYATGVNHQFSLGQRTYLKSTVSVSGQWFTNDQDTIRVVDTEPLDRQTFPVYDAENTETRYQVATQLNHKINSRHNLRFGGFAKRYEIDQTDSVVIYPYNTTFQDQRVQPLRAMEESLQLYQLYGQWQWRLSQDLTANIGLHSQYLDLTEELVLEPRLGLTYQVAPRHTVSAGYGLHHQMQDLQVYFVRPDGVNLVNDDLQFTRSNHFVAGYGYQVTPSIALKLEGYYQYLDQVPVSVAPGYASTINAGVNFEPPLAIALANDGTAENIGLELTLEKSFTNWYYFLLTGSVYDAQYTASDGNTYSTAFDNGYVVNALGGLEVPVGKQQANQVFADLNLTLAGGFRVTPIDLAASRAAAVEILDETNPYGEQVADYLRLDAKVGFRQNFRKWSQEFSFQAQNATANQNVFSQNYNPVSGDVVTRYQLGFFPVVFYKVQF